MSAFACVWTGAPGEELERRVAAAAREMGVLGLPAPSVLREGGFAVVVAGGGDRPAVARRGGLAAVGEARLDHPAEVAALAGVDGAGLGHLELVLAAFAARGPECFASVLGDFALVVWDPAGPTLHAARDPFGARLLFHREEAGATTFASHLRLVGGPRRPDPAYVAGFLAAGGRGWPPRTVWEGCSSALPGHTLSAGAPGAAPLPRPFWHPERLLADPIADPRPEELLALLEEGIATRLADGAPVWAQLSGGLDSSSVVSVARRMEGQGRLPNPLGGTLTLVDPLGRGDEERYVEAVLGAYPGRHERVGEWWAWQDDGDAPPLTGEPRLHFPFWARDRRAAAVMRRAGARAVLTGIGSDHYLQGSLHFVTDRMASGRVLAALGELARYSVEYRGSFWTMLRDWAVVPLIPHRLRRSDPREDAHPLPGWLRRDALRRLDGGGHPAPPIPAVRSRYARHLLETVSLLATSTGGVAFDAGVEMRHPFLYRPLVEYGLRTPPERLLRPHQTKLLLREAVRGILPESVRARPGKGAIDSRILWSLSREGARLDAMLRDPLLAQTGWIEPEALRGAVEGARAGRTDHPGALMATLALESWLRVQQGEWAEGRPGSSAA